MSMNHMIESHTKFRKVERVGSAGRGVCVCVCGRWRDDWRRYWCDTDDDDDDCGYDEKTIMMMMDHDDTNGDGDGDADDGQIMVYMSPRCFMPSPL